MVVLADQQRAVTLPQATPNTTTAKFVPQLQRFFQNFENVGPPNPNTVSSPTPGPTLRAELGDIVEL